MSNVETAIRDFLLLKGVQPFWLDSAISNIRQGLATNAYFVTNVLTQRATVQDGHVTAYTATVTSVFPNVGRGDPMVMELRYSFKPTRKQAHRVTAQLVASPACR